MLRRLIATVAVLLSLGGLAVVSAAPASATQPGECFGYTGTFANNGVYPAFVGPVSWPNGAQNCFGISPGRHIWVTAPGHPWSVIPGGGLADGISGFAASGTSSLYSKTVQVWVASSDHYFCQTWWSNSGWTGSWSRCYW